MKMKKSSKVLISVLVLTIVFATGVLANEMWLKFTGKDDAQLIEDNMSEIIEILESVDGKRFTAEALAQELAVKITDKNSTISKLEKTIQQLEDQIEGGSENKEYIKHLEKELKKANKQVEDTRKESDKYLKEAEKYLPIK